MDQLFSLQPFVHAEATTARKKRRGRKIKRQLHVQTNESFQRSVTALRRLTPPAPGEDI
jgi:hypothetical protein